MNNKIRFSGTDAPILALVLSVYLSRTEIINSWFYHRWFHT